MCLKVINRTGLGWMALITKAKLCNMTVAILILFRRVVLEHACSSQLAIIIKYFQNNNNREMKLSSHFQADQASRQIRGYLAQRAKSS